MQNENRFLSPAALLFVIAAHALLYWLLVSVKPPELPAEPPGLSFVDLGMLGGGGGGGGNGGDTVVEEEAAPIAGQPDQAPAPPQPKPEPPKPEQRAQIKPVERPDRPADIVQPKPQPEHKPVRPEPKPEPRPETKPAAPAHTPANTPPATSSSHSAGGSSGQGHGAPSAGSGGGSGGSGGSGGGQGTGQGTGQGSGKGPGSGSGEGGGHGSGIGTGNGAGTGGGGGGDSNPTHLGGYLNNPKPPYPPQLEEEGISGTVRLRVMVEANGKPSSVEVVSATHPLFGRSAEQTVRNRFTFVPAKRNGQPVRASYTFTLRFTAP